MSSTEKEKYAPYLGDDDLPAFEVVVAAKGGRPATVKLAEPRLIAQAISDGKKRIFKVYGYYKHPHGVLRKLFCVLKPSKARPNDVALIEKLRRSGIQGLL